MKPGHIFTVFSNAVAQGAGKPITFCLAFVLILAWGISGPIFQYSETWQLVVNTATTIVTFLMVFVLQNSQNRDSEALQAKLDELILTSTAQNKFVGAENLDENELRQLSRQLHDQAEKLEARAGKTPKRKGSAAVSEKQAATQTAKRQSPSTKAAAGKTIPTGRSKRTKS